MSRERRDPDFLGNGDLLNQAAGAGLSSPLSFRDDPERGALAVLRAFRNRSLLVSVLRLTLFSAAVNELFRWASVAAIRWLNLDLPALNIGPLFFGAALFITLRKRNLAAAAVDADRVLGLKDRFSSFIDFRLRADITPAFKRAQVGETRRALKGVSLRKAVPLPAYLYLGPLLLAASLIYPLFIFSSGGISVVTLLRHPAVPDGTPPLYETPEDSLLSPDDGGDDDAPSPGESGSAAGETSSPGTAEEGRPDRREHFASAPDKAGNGAPPLNRPWELLQRIGSETIGAKLSPVVEPAFPGAEEGGKEEGAIRGRMIYRIVPSSSVGVNGAGTALSVSPPVELVIDFDSIAVRYRLLVKKYFSLLNGKPEEQRKEDG